MKTNRNMKILIHALLVICTLLYSGCTRSRRPDTLPEIRIGVLPDQSKERLEEIYKPLVEYLTKELNLPCRLVIPKDYGQLVDQFKSGQLDVAYFGGYTFVIAEHNYGAQPLVMRDIDEKFITYFIAQAKRPEKKISEFKNKKFSFGSDLSTSGHLMPRHFMREQQIVPELFFSKVLYSGSHDKTVEMVQQGIVDLGALNSRVLDKMVSEGKIKRSAIQIVWETPPYADYVWAVQSSLPEGLKNKLRDAFLKLRKSEDAHREILKNMTAEYFIPASMRQFVQLKKVVEEQKLLGGNP